MTSEQMQAYDKLIGEARGLLMDARAYMWTGAGLEGGLEGDKRVKLIDQALAKIVRARTMLLKYA